MSDLNEDMKNTADFAIRSAKERFGLILDFSDPSITALESILEKIYWGLSGTPDEGSVKGLVYNTAMIWGAYLGEFMRIKWGGSWILEGSDQILMIKNIRFAPVNYIYIKILDHRNPSVNDFLLDANWKISASKSEPPQEIIPVTQVEEIVQPIKPKPTKKAVKMNKDMLTIAVIYGAIFLVGLVFITLLVYVLKGRILTTVPAASQASTITNTPGEIVSINATLNPTNTPLPTVTILPSYSPSPSMTASPSQTPSPTATQTPTLTPTPTRTRTPKTPSITPTLKPVIPTDTAIPPTKPPTPTVYVPPPVVLESCGVDPSSIQPGNSVGLVFTADFSAPGYGFDTDLSPGFPGQNGCSGVDDNGDGTASCDGSSGLLPQSTTVTVTFKSPVGNCVASYGTP